jgi:hypothetical protein
VAIVARGSGCIAALGIGGCRPSDVLSVPAPAGAITSGALQSQAGAENVFAGAKGALFETFAGASSSNIFDNNAGFVQWGELLTDEFGWTEILYDPFDANIDARATAGGGGYYETGDNAAQGLLAARASLLLAEGGLQRFEPPSGQVKIGEAYALIGYTELLLAEEFCAGVPLSAVLPTGGIVYGMPLTTDSLLGVAEAHFDSAVVYAGGDATAGPLAGIGLARARLDRGHFAGASEAVTGVPTTFVYNAELEPTGFGGSIQPPNLYTEEFPAAGGNCGNLNVSDREGETGLNFVTAGDPRLVIDSTLAPTCDGGTWYYPVKFGVDVHADVPLATGIEARLIEAEAALQAGSAGEWSADINALRQTAITPAMDTLSSDSTTAAGATEQVDVLFRERAFWLFGTGTRLGDLRRIIRQYGRDANTVFPTGPYANGTNPALPSPLPNYGTDVNLTLPTAAGEITTGITTSNPNYKGCLTTTKTA